MLAQEKTIEVLVWGGGPRCREGLEVANRICKSTPGLNLAGYVMDRHARSKKNPRYTMYDEFNEYPLILPAVAENLGIPIFSNRMKGSFKIGKDGYSKFLRWLYPVALKRDLGDNSDLYLLILVICFGQHINRLTRELANGWIINTHPNRVGEPWRKENPFRGPQPYEEMFCARRRLEKEGKSFQFNCEIVAHVISKEFDRGEKICSLGNVPLVKYNGPLTHERIHPSAAGQTIRVRSHALGKPVHDMHLAMKDPTGKITRKILTNKELISAILMKKRPTKEVIRRISKSMEEIRPNRTKKMFRPKRDER